MSDIKIIHGDNFETSGGAQYIAKDNAVQINLSQQAPVSELLALLDKVKQDLSALPVPEAVKQDVEHEVQGALRQAQRNPPDRKKIANMLRNATLALKGSAKTVKEAVVMGNMLGQCLIWCGEQWTNWVVG